MISPISLPELAPGTVISLTNLTELPPLEDAIAPLVRPNYDPLIWASRPSIGDQLRPPKFNGSLKDISLTVMDHPYDQLVTHRERGWHLNKSGGGLERNILSSSTISSYLGFAFSAIAHSTGRGEIGTIEAELYYYPPALVKTPSGTIKTRRRLTNAGVKIYTHTTKQDSYYSSGTKTGETIRRSVTKPKLEEGKFIELDATSRRIGCSVLRGAIAHAISTGMRD